MVRWNLCNWSWYSVYSGRNVFAAAWRRDGLDEGTYGADRAGHGAFALDRGSADADGGLFGLLLLAA